MTAPGRPVEEHRGEKGGIHVGGRSRQVDGGDLDRLPGAWIEGQHGRLDRLSFTELRKTRGHKPIAQRNFALFSLGERVHPARHADVREDQQKREPREAMVRVQVVEWKQHSELLIRVP